MFYITLNPGHKHPYYVNSVEDDGDMIIVNVFTDKEEAGCLPDDEAALMERAKNLIACRDSAPLDVILNTNDGSGERHSISLASISPDYLVSTTSPLEAG